MPQMAPYSWLMLSIYFNIVMMMFILHLHSFKLNSNKYLNNPVSPKVFKIKW